MKDNSAIIKCRKCKVEGILELNDWSTHPLLNYYLPKGWSYISKSFYCKVHSTEIRQKIRDILK